MRLRLVVRYTTGLRESDRVQIRGRVHNIRFIDNIGFANKWLQIDVDGGERNVIYGALETFKKHKPTLVIEVKFLNKFGRDDLLSRIGYRCVEKVSPIDEVWVASR